MYGSAPVPPPGSIVDRITWSLPAMFEVEELVDRLAGPGRRSAGAPHAGRPVRWLGFVGEELRDRQVQGVRDPLDGGDRRAGDVALDLRQEALGHAGPLARRRAGSGDVA